MVLRQLGLVVEFPSGSTVLIPSATVTHENIPVGRDETRALLVHFTSGGIFRYAEYGFRTERAIEKEDRQRWDKLKAEREDKRFDDV